MNKKMLLHGCGVFLTISALQAFLVQLDISKEIGWLWYWEFIKTVIMKDIFIKLLISFVTSFIIIRHMNRMYLKSDLPKEKGSKTPRKKKQARNNTNLPRK